MNTRCTACHQQIPKDSRFCVHCGKQLNSNFATVESQEEIFVPNLPKRRLFEVINIIILAIATICIAGFVFYFIDTKTQGTADRDIKNEEIIDNLYRNTKYKFRIKFPEKWRIEKGDGPNILIKATNDNGSSINILVKDTGVAIGDIDEIMTIDEWGDSVYEKFPDANILLKEETLIDNKKAFKVKYSVVYKTLDREANSTMYNFALTNSNFFYSITAGAKTRFFDVDKLKLETAISTFVIEN